MQVYLHLGDVPGGAGIVNEENLRPLTRRFCRSHEDIGEEFVDKTIVLIEKIMICDPSVNGGQYYCLIDDSHLMIFFSENRLNIVSDKSFKVCHENLKNEKGRLLMSRVCVFNIEDLVDSFNVLGILKIRLNECNAGRIKKEIVDGIHAYWEKLYVSVDRERTVMYTSNNVQKNTGRGDESFC